MSETTATHGLDLTVRAFAEARRLGVGWVGPEHFLLALLAYPSAATEVLNDLGVDHRQVEDYFRALLVADRPVPYDDGDPVRSGPNPVGHQLIGRAQGIAVAWGYPRPTPEQWLLAMIYDDRNVCSVLHILGVSQRTILDCFRDRGLRTPDIDPPWYRPWRGRHNIVVGEAELGPLLARLAGRHPPGSEWRWGFNWLPGHHRTASVNAEDGIDLEAIYAEVKTWLKFIPPPE